MNKRVFRYFLKVVLSPPTPWKRAEARRFSHPTQNLTSRTAAGSPRILLKPGRRQDKPRSGTTVRNHSVWKGRRPDLGDQTWADHADNEIDGLPCIKAQIEQAEGGFPSQNVPNRFFNLQPAPSCWNMRLRPGKAVLPSCDVLALPPHVANPPSVLKTFYGSNGLLRERARAWSHTLAGQSGPRGQNRIHQPLGIKSCAARQRLALDWLVLKLSAVLSGTNAGDLLQTCVRREQQPRLLKVVSCSWVF